MRHLLAILFSLYSFLVFSQEWKPVNGVRSLDDQYHSFENVSIYQNGRYIEDAVLIIKGDKIFKVGKVGEIEIPSNAIRHHLNGKFIWPSFIEIYSDFGIKKAEPTKGPRPQLESLKKGPYYYNQAIKPESNAVDLFSYDKKKAEQLRKMGFGLVSAVEKDGVLRGISALIALNEQDDQQVITPKTAMHYSFYKGSSKQTYPSSLMGMIALIRQAWYDANWYEANQNETNYNASLEALSQNRDLIQIIDAGSTQSILRAQKIADEFDLEFLIKGNGTAYQRLKEIKESEASLIVPLDFPKPYDVSDPFDAMRLPLQKMKEWELADHNPALLQENNIPYVFTADGLKSEKELNKNLERSIKNGLKREAAIDHFTIDVAQFLGVEDKAGSIEEGKLANFLISSDSLFSDKNQLISNWVLGEEYSIHANDEIKISGKYSLNIAKKKQFDLLVEERNGKLTAKVSDKGEDAFKKAKIKLESNRVNLVFDYDASTYRLSGTISDSLSRIWSGKLVYQGEWTDWAAIRKARSKRRKEAADSAKIDSVEKEKIMHPKVQYPNMAYGWDSIPTASSIVFRNATVWTNEDGIKKKHDVVIHDGKIKMVGYKINLDVMFPEIKNELIEIDLSGKHLTSGIIDEHSHIAIDRGVNESGEAISAEVRIGDVIDSDDINIYRQLAGGVTASQLLHGSANPIGGQSALIKMRWGKAPEEMKIQNADGFIKFALGENVKQSNWGDYNRVRFPQTRMGVEQVYYDAFHRADEYRDIKRIREAQKPKERKLSTAPRVDLELEALSEILDTQRFITCHSYIQSEINMLMHVADSMKFRVNTFTHILEGYKVADKMKEHGVAASTFSDWWAYKFEVNDAIPYNAALLNEQGVLTGINSDDAEMGRRLNQEAAKAVKYGGASQEDAWKMVTLNPAKMLHLDDRMGSIKEGKDADLVVWSDNPLSIYAIAEQTYVDGICYYDSQRNIELSRKNAMERERLIKLMLKASSKGQATQKVKGKKPKNYHCDDLEQ